MVESINIKSKMSCNSKENIRNVRSKSEEKKVKRPGSSFIWFNKHEREKLKNVESENGLRNFRESEIRKLIKEKYNSLSVAEKSTYVDDKKANYWQYKEKLSQGPPKHTICTRMSVIGAHNVIANLTKEQRDSVRSIGLGSLLDLRSFNICTELCSILVSAFNCDSCTLDINSTNVGISPGDVSNILGLKDSGIEVSRNVTSTVISGASVHLKLGNLKVELQNMKTADEKFKSKFTLFILGIFLCPVVKAEVDSGLLYIVDDTSKISEMNLAKLVFTCLVEGIRERQQTGNKYVRGCLAFFMVSMISYVLVLISII
ncbi:hypothetical protein ACJIZ3_008813 [Penstemon smallii]|uniref:HMG box domain-containing protein n=1 Tax=Penstemon smallii TaxID=265156 RepID=A0ABD3TAU1_9LAMI